MTRQHPGGLVVCADVDGCHLALIERGNGEMVDSSGDANA